MDTLDNSIRRVLEKWRDTPGALLPILHALQDELGYVPPEGVPLIAADLNLSRAEVHGVVSYYHHFRQTPPGRHVLRVCRAEACQAVGADALIAHVQKTLGCGFHETSPDGSVSLEPVYCLGQCAAGPAVSVDEVRLYGRVTPEAVDALLAELRGKP